MKKTIRIIISGLFLFFSTAYAQIERVSVSSSGEQGNNYSGIHSVGTESVSADGRIVAFTSEASNLVPGDTNGIRDVFIHDRNTGITERVSVSSSGEQGSSSLYNPDGSVNPSISADGRYVAFSSDANNLVSDDINGSFADVFLHDRQTGLTALVSFDKNGEQRTYSSRSPSISADGRFITYQTGQVYLYDRVTNVTVRVSSSPDGRLANSSSFGTTISANGRYVAYESYASNLNPECTYLTHIFVYDRISGFNECISKSPSGEQGDYFSHDPSISADGRYLSFTSDASNLTLSDLDGNGTDIFVHDRQTGLTELVSVSSSGEQGDYRGSSSYQSVISADGRFVTFDNNSTNLVSGGTDGNSLIFVHDRLTGLTDLVSKSESGEHADFFSAGPTLSPDGMTIVFQSSATNLVSGDTNRADDIFAVDNPLAKTGNDLVAVEKLINNETRETFSDAAKLATGTLYRQSYKVTNNSPNRIYQVKVFEDGIFVCNFYALNPGQTRQRCDTFQTILDGEQYRQVTVSAKDSRSGQALTGSTDAYYTGLNVSGELRVTHRINNVNADSLDQAPSLASSQATLSYKVENTGEIELYQVKTYHDPVGPVNSGWALQCLLGPLKPGQIRYCNRSISLDESGLNYVMGRVQGRNAIRSATKVVNASNPTYFIAP